MFIRAGKFIRIGKVAGAFIRAGLFIRVGKEAGVFVCLKILFCCKK